MMSEMDKILRDDTLKKEAEKVGLLVRVGNDNSYAFRITTGKFQGLYYGVDQALTFVEGWAAALAYRDEIEILTITRIDESISEEG